MLKAVIFDLDDTLYPEKQFVMSGFNLVSNYISDKYDFEYDLVFNILKNDFENGLRRKNFNTLLEKLKIKNLSLYKLIQCYREHKPSLSLYSDAETLLNEIKDKFKLGMITDGHIITQNNKIEALEIKDYFDTIIINDISQGMSKKKQQPFITALKALKVDSESAIYVGDNPLKDFVKAKKMGIMTIRIKRDYGEYSNINVSKDYEADYVVSDLLKIIKISKNFSWCFP